MDDTTANDGSIESVMASIIVEPQKDEDEPREALGQADEADADDQTDADAGDADEADAGDDVDDGADDGDTDTEEDEQTEQTFTVKVNGREQDVPLSELLRGYSGQAYIQQRMQEVASARQEAENLFSTLQSERQQLAQFVQAAQDGHIPIRPPAMPDDQLLQTDPIGYLEARVKFDKDLAAFQQTQAAMQELNARTAQAEERARMVHLAEEHRQLAQIIPAFAKPETAAKLKQELIGLGTEVYGYAPEELRSVTDHRALRVLHDAAMYRRLMAGKSAAEKRTEAPRTPVIRPGAKAAPAAVGKRATMEKARTQMKRTGSVDDVARFLLM